MSSVPLPILTLAELADRRRVAPQSLAPALDPAAPPIVLLDLAAPLPPEAPPALDGTVGTVLIGVGEATSEAAAWCDILVDSTEDPAVATIAATVERTPVASAALVALLRAQVPGTVAAGLEAESALYSALQAGAEHQAWRVARTRRPIPAPDRPPVRVEREGDRLVVTLDRPDRHNAFSAAMRDGLLDALQVAALDPALRVELRGAGPSFCSGGDLDEFGLAGDPAVAHLVRLQASAAAAMAGLCERTTVHLHGACFGAGIELPAFAGHVTATADVRIALPELALGLIPGAGGTVSLPRRIGRHRTAWLALTGTAIDGPTALGWGLVDELA